MSKKGAAAIIERLVEEVFTFRPNIDEDGARALVCAAILENKDFVLRHCRPSTADPRSLPRIGPAGVTGLPA